MLVFIANPALAIDESNVDVITPSIYSPHEIQLNANVNVGLDTTVEVWFAYGLHLDRLTKTTEPQLWNRGYHFMSEKIIDLDPGTQYYYQALIRHGGLLYETDINVAKTLPGITFDNTEEGSGETDADDAGIEIGISSLFKGLKNPFGYFKRNKDKNENVEELVVEEKDPVEYSDEPVGGVVNKDSVFYTNDDGEVIEYSDEYRNQFKQHKKNNRPWVIFIVLLLVGVVIWLFMKTHRRRPSGPNTRQSRIERLNKHRYSQRYASQEQIHTPPAQVQQSYVNPNVSMAQDHSTSSNNSVGYQGAPTIKRPKTEGTFFKAPPKR